MSFGFSLSTGGKTVPDFTLPEQKQKFFVMQHGDEFSLDLESKVAERRVLAEIMIDGVEVWIK